MLRTDKLPKLNESRNPGTLFGDDIRITRRNPVSSAMWSHGLPLHGIDSELIGTGRWYIEPDEEDNTYFDGVSTFETGTDANGKCFITSKNLNRYQPGQLSYFIYTAAFQGINDANGNYLCMIGAFLRGLASDGDFGKIKEGFGLGFKNIEGHIYHIFRVYKNFEYTEEVLPYVPDGESDLNIYRLEIGYLGIHPSILYKVNLKNLTDTLLHVKTFKQDLTSVSNPNLAIGLYLENQGNTTNIQIKNGSLQFGNYAERMSPDPSARPLQTDLSIAAIDAGTDVVIAAYTVPEKITMYKELNTIDTTLTGEFRNTIANKLLSIQAIATANKPITLNIYFVPKTDVVANFTPINPNVNVLENAIGGDITSVDLTQASKIAAIVPINNGQNMQATERNFLLTSEIVAVITTTCTQAITDFEAILGTEDLF